MGARDRIHRYRTTGGAADLVRVEVLVPLEARDGVLSLAKRLREEHRRRKAVRSVNAEQVNDRAKLIIHRLLARRVASDPRLVDQAREALSRARTAGDTFEHMGRWAELLARDPVELRRLLTARTDEMYRLRISSPLALVAGMEDSDLRRRIWRNTNEH